MTKPNLKNCIRCSDEFIPAHNRHRFCKECAKKRKLEMIKKSKKRAKQGKISDKEVEHYVDYNLKHLEYLEERKREFDEWN